MGTNEIAAEGPSDGHDSSRSDVGGATQRGPGVGVAGDSEDASLDLSLPADTIHTLVVLDGAGRLRITDLEDAAGSQVRPSGRAGPLPPSLASRNRRRHPAGRGRRTAVPPDPGRWHARTLTHRLAGRGMAIIA